DRPLHARTIHRQRPIVAGGQAHGDRRSPPEGPPDHHGDRRQPGNLAMHDHEAQPDDANGHTALDESPIHIDLRARTVDEGVDPCAARFHIFVIDTGWNGPVSKAVRAHLPLMARFTKEDPVFVLTPEMSVEVLREAPELIGHDPIILVYDLVKPPG